MQTIHELEEEINNVPGRYKRPEKDADGKLMRHVKYWSRENDHMVWRKLKDAGLHGEELKDALEAKWTAWDEVVLPEVVKPLNKRQQRNAREVAETAKRLENEMTRKEEDADIAKGLGLRDDKGMYWTWAELKDNERVAAYREDFIKRRDEQAKLSVTPQVDEQTALLLAQYKIREALQDAHERDVRARESSIEALLNWTEEDSIQRDESRATYIAFCEKHFGHITHFCDTPDTTYNTDRVKELLHAEYEFRFDTIDITKLSRQERIAHKNAIEKSVDTRETEGRVKGVIWVKDKNRWRVYVDGKHHGYFLNQLDACTKLREIAQAPSWEHT